MRKRNKDKSPLLLEVWNKSSKKPQSGRKKRILTGGLSGLAIGIAFGAAAILNINNRPSHQTYGYYDGRFETSGHSVAISFNRVARDGMVEDHKRLKSYLNYRFQLGTDDAFSKTFQTCLNQAHTTLMNNPDSIALLCKAEWTYDDRITWERTLAETVSETMDSFPGLNTYRTEVTDDCTRDPNLNALSSDIENDTQTYEFDCEAMSIVEGLLIQSLENQILDERINKTNWKYQGTYYYVTGHRSDADNDTLENGHAFIMSYETGNIIEAVIDPSETERSPYYVAENDNFTFHEFISGIPFVYNPDKEDNVEPKIFGVNMHKDMANHVRALYEDASKNDTPRFKITISHAPQ